mgnify:CR=1 FL=1
MFDAISRSLLGPWGEKILDLVLRHQLLFSGVIVLGAVMVLTIRKVRRQKTHDNDKRNHQ